MKTALVTGATEGIGLAIVRRLAAEGYGVTLVARNEERLKNVAASLPGGLHIHWLYPADLTSPWAVDKLVGLVQKVKFDLLVNNAGVGVYGQFVKKSIDDHLKLVQVNCEAAMWLSHAFLSTAERGAALVNVTSGTAYTPIPFGASYCASKAFLTNLSQALWFEHRRRGVYVMALVPGLTTDTKFHGRAGGSDENAPPAFLGELSANVAEVMMRGLEKRSKPIVYSNRWNRFMIFLSRILSRKATVSMMGGIWEKHWI